MKQRILMVLEAGDAYPSGYVRGLIYRENFIKNGDDVCYVNRQWAALIRFLFNPPLWVVPFLSRALTGFLYRVADGIAFFNESIIVSRAKRVDVVYTCKVTSLRLIQRLRQETQARVVLDFGDALWLPAAGIPHFDDLLRQVDAVTTDNDYSAAHVLALNAHCTIVPDYPQLEEFDRLRSSVHRKLDGSLTLGWVGTESSVFNLFVIWEVLEKLFVKYPHLRLRLVGTGPDTRRLPPFENVKYTCVARYDRSDMIREVLAMDIGLFPLHDVEACRVRGILKATVYMAGGVPAAASPVGQSKQLIQDGVNGVLARSSQEWEEKLERLIQDPAYRLRLAAAGLDTVCRQFTLENSFSKLRQALTPVGDP